MRLMFIYWPFEDQGSGLVIQGYSAAAEALGHQVVVYGRENPKIPLNNSLVFESPTPATLFSGGTTAWGGANHPTPPRMGAKGRGGRGVSPVAPVSTNDG